jgi:hypothetical protein
LQYNPKLKNNQEGDNLYSMEKKLITFIKIPAVFRALYLISCMVIAFGLGIMTQYSISNKGNQPIFEIPDKPLPLAMRYKNQTIQNAADYAIAEPTEPIQANSATISITNTKNFVASKSGTYYYPAGCGGISRIKEENRLYFATEQDAQDKGYTRTDTCK